MPEVASQTFDLVGREVNATLAEARGALETYVEQPDNVTLLERCARELHQVQGVLRLLEIYGAALLAEEMEHVAMYLLATHSERKSQAESLDALMRAMVQLPSYLERVLAGGRDLALVLLPLLNDLRAVRGNALLSEGTLLLLNLKSDQQAQPQQVAPGEAPMTIEHWARRLRARYQVGLIGWIRGERVEQNLEILAAVARKLEQLATRQPVFQLWWVIGAVMEALQEKGLESGQSVKRLLGLGDREIRRLYEQGEARYAQSPPVELLNNLLYYIGRSESSGPRVNAVRVSFRLSELLPVDESIEQERENLSAPSVKLMQTVAAAIREDLGKVKDVLDIFVRRGAGQPQELGAQVDMLRKIGDTLGVLGLGELRANVQRETERLQQIVAGTLKADEATLVEIAATLIGVEDKLDSQLVGMILPRDAARQAARGGGHRRDHHAIAACHATGPARAAAGLHRPPGGRDRQPRVLHGDGAGGTLGPLVHARQRPGVCAGARAAADPCGAHGRAVRSRRLCAHGADSGPRAPAGAAPGRGRGGRLGTDAGAIERRPAGHARRCGPRAAEAVHRGSARGAHPDSARLPRLGSQSARARFTGHRAPLVPYPQGKRPHGRRTRARRVRVGDREPAQPRPRQHPERAVPRRYSRPCARRSAPCPS